MSTRGRGEARECPVTVHGRRCGGYTAPKQLMCRAHWSKVPPARRTAVWRAWGRWNETHSDEDWTDYLTARERALEAVDSPPGGPL